VRVLHLDRPFADDDDLITSFKSLEVLALLNHAGQFSYEAVASLPNLSSLALESATVRSSASALTRLSRLTQLSLADCDSFMDSDLELLTLLRSLTLYRSSPTDESVRNLQVLYLLHGAGVSVLPLQFLTNLVDLRIEDLDFFLHPKYTHLLGLHKLERLDYDPSGWQVTRVRTRTISPWPKRSWCRFSRACLRSR